MGGGRGVFIPAPRIEIFRLLSGHPPVIFLRLKHGLVAGIPVRLCAHCPTPLIQQWRQFLRLELLIPLAKWHCQLPVYRVLVNI